MISVVAWMFLFGTKTLPIQDNILTLAGISMACELAFELILVAILYYYKNEMRKKR